LFCVMVLLCNDCFGGKFLGRKNQVRNISQ
jgi:hypothetical protein